MNTGLTFFGTIGNEDMIAPAQFWAPLGLLNWPQDNFAKPVETRVLNIYRFEFGKALPRKATLTVPWRALEAARDDFLSEVGIASGALLRSCS
jgi:hypothetical protein